MSSAEKRCLCRRENFLLLTFYSSGLRLGLRLGNTNIHIFHSPHTRYSYTAQPTPQTLSLSTHAHLINTHSSYLPCNMTSPARAVTTLVVALVALLSVLANPVDAACSCNYGSVDISSPQCVCACYPSYLQPNCLYTATDMVPIGIYVNISTTQFDSYNMTSTLVWGMGVSSSDASTAVTFTYARPTVVSYTTYTRYLIRGDYAQSLLWDFRSRASWQASVGIIGVYEEIILNSGSGNVEVDTTTVIYETKDKRVIVTISTVAWALAALITTILMACIDNLFLHNTEAEVESIQALIEEQQQQMRIMRAHRRGVNGDGQTTYDNQRETSRYSSGHTKNPLEVSNANRMDY